MSRDTPEWKPPFMKTRIITAAVGLGVLAVVLAFFDTFLFDLVLSAVCLIAIHEVFSAMGFGKKQWYLYAAAVPLTLLVMLSTSQMVRGLLLPAAFLTGFIYFSGVITFCFYSLIHLKRMLPFAEYRYDAIYFILLILCFAWGGDTAAYFAGRAFGRHKLAPIVSPHKTVEGAVGGVLGSMAAGCVLTLAYSLLSAKYNVISIQVQPKHYLVLLGMGAVASVLGILGDLFASSVKRQVGIKDYGTIFPGHGGILDRFDSVMFIAPFVSIAVRYFFYLL